MKQSEVGNSAWGDLCFGNFRLQLNLVDNVDLAVARKWVVPVLSTHLRTTFLFEWSLVDIPEKGRAGTLLVNCLDKAFVGTLWKVLGPALFRGLGLHLDSKGQLHCDLRTVPRSHMLQLLVQLGSTELVPLEGSNLRCCHMEAVVLAAAGRALVLCTALYCIRGSAVGRALYAHMNPDLVHFCKAQRQWNTLDSRSCFRASTDHVVAFAPERMSPFGVVVLVVWG